MSAKHAVLGLVIERPGHGYELAQRLQERFGSSGFAPSGVYSALEQLSRDGLVRAAGLIGSRGAATRLIYEATDAGLDHFEEWMFESSPTPPLRDDLQIKIALCRPRNVARLIDTLYGQELACIARMRELDLHAEQDAAGDPRGWPRLMRALARDAEIATWEARVQWLRSARERLELLLEETRRRQLTAGVARQPVPMSETERAKSRGLAIARAGARCR